MRVVTIVGARPQFIKAAMVSRALTRYGQIDEVIVHTGQHFDTNMDEIFFEQMMIPRPAYNLGIHGGSHGAMTGRMIEKIEERLVELQPDLVLVYGDTNSTLAGALAASKLRIAIAHVEAGLRSHRMEMPEEVNRVLTDRLSRFLFCPTEKSVRNLHVEGYECLECKISRPGDVMQDAALRYSARAQPPSGISMGVIEGCVLCTFHRAENTDDPRHLACIVEALNEIHSQMNVVVPLHPRTRMAIDQFGLNLNAEVLEPVGYFEMLYLLKHCRFVCTDSGGLQKEAYFFGKPCVTLRNETEWVELVDAGASVLVGASKRGILDAAAWAVEARLTGELDLYGSGLAADRIAETISQGWA